MVRKALLFALLLVTFALTAKGQSENHWQLRLMPQVAFGTKNELQRPGNEGTRISLGRDLDRKNNALFSPRIEVEYNFGRHHLTATAALLRDRFEGSAPYDIIYNGTLFERGTTVGANYRFDTYRVGYRYRIVDREKLAFELGATVLVRDAVISLENPTRKRSYYNVGIAPLLSYHLEWMPAAKLSLLSYGDLFAVKAGRAEDVFAGIKYRFSPLISAMAGYRLLEGGSDGDKIYTMSTFHYLSLGIGFTF